MTGVGVGEGEGVKVGVGVLVTDGVRVVEAVWVGVAVSVAVALAVGKGVIVAVEVGVTGVTVISRASALSWRTPMINGQRSMRSNTPLATQKGGSALSVVRGGSIPTIAPQKAGA